MNQEKICIIVDSGCDVPEHFRNKYGIRVLPLKILYPEGEYLDQVNITADQVYDRLENCIPKTSLPDGGTIQAVLEEAKEQGCTHALVICISSGLSGTSNLVRIVSQDVAGITTHVFDTKNISFGSGVFAILAGQLVQAGSSWEGLLEKLYSRLEDSRVFFCVDTLEYLHKGGRLGLVSAIVGTALKLKPIISCNPEGVYYTAGKALGRKRSVERMLEMAAEFAKKKKDSVVSVLNGKAVQEAGILKAHVLEVLGVDSLMTEGQISPALVVHTGPGLLGIHVLRGGLGEI